MTTYHLAQLNIGRIVAPLDSPELAGFVARLADINALADGTPGFVWRLQTEDGDATALRPYGDDRLLMNLSVWESLEALRAFVYRSPHVDVMRQRRSWFESLTEAFVVLWWVPAGHRPSVDEAKDRLELLRREGESTRAFSFRRPFPAPDARAEETLEPSTDECPAT
jgi:heme-degrading monooxygenase HmoA